MLPTPDELSDFIFASRYGELEELRELVNRFGPTCLKEAHDENGNTCLHMAAANGHEGKFCYFVLSMGLR